MGGDLVLDGESVDSGVYEQMVLVRDLRGDSEVPLLDVGVIHGR